MQILLSGTLLTFLSVLCPISAPQVSMEHDLPKPGCLIFVCFIVISQLKQGNNKLSLPDVIVCQTLLTLRLQSLLLTKPTPYSPLYRYTTSGFSS